MTTAPISDTIAPSARLAPALFTLTIFTSASLLFFVQPLFTRIVLPTIGGAPAVWTTAMLFFQTALILGYLYAHFLTRHVAVKAQVAVHIVLWTGALFFLPLAIPEGWEYDASGSTAWQTLTLYALGVGLPFTFLSANAPLIQAWYARSGGPSAHDPYFLYGASNLGSLLALLAFPLAAEPLFGMTDIGRGWAWGFAVLGALLLACGIAARKPAPLPAASEPATQAPPTLRQMAGWALLAFIPSSMMLGVTSKMSTDLGSIPLIWVIPLALYLLTFVLVFTQRSFFASHRLRPAFMVALAVLVAMSTSPTLAVLNWTTSPIVVLAFFVAALMAHRVLYERRPDRAHLTVFYVVMSVGGALGGLFNSILAPVIFNDIHELRVAVALAALLLFVPGHAIRAHDLALGVAVGLFALLPAWLGVTVFQSLQTNLTGIMLGCILLIGLVYLARKGAAPVAAVMVVVVIGVFIGRTDALYRDRSFFGAHKVFEANGFRFYSNGTTIHGAERLEDLGQSRPAPMTYYHATAPMGQILSSPRGQAAKSIGIVGLGVGALSCYALPGQEWHFYEIDQKVDEIARDPALFTYMSSCAGDAPTHLGDARIVLAKETDRRFDILVVDAYSSDAVPVHLTTAEALALYRDRLAPGGVLVFHITNRYYYIEVPLGRGAAALGMPALIQMHGDNEEVVLGALGSIVVAMAADEAALADLAANSEWQPLGTDGRPVWTDDFANVLSILKR